MAISYPTGIDTLTNPTSGQGLNSPSHSSQHADANDAIEALEAKVGANSSAVATSHDYKLGEVTGTDKAVGKTATQTLTNKTLTSPAVNLGSDATGDMYYRNSGGALTRLPIGTSGQILNVDGTGIPAYIANPSAADASTTVKGVSEEATLAETLARTAAGGTSARLFVNPTNLTTVQTYDYAASSGGTDTYAITVTPAPTAYVTGQVYRFKADVANTGDATLNVNALGAKTIYKGVDNSLVDNDILANQLVEVIYDGTNFQLLSPLSNGRYYAGSLTTRSGTAGNNDNVNTDETITIGFRPRFIKLHFYIMGYSGGTGNRANVGSALFSGTTLFNTFSYLSGSNSNLIPSSTADNNTATLSTANTFSTRIDDTTPLQGGDLGSNNGVKLLATINSISGTGFVFRLNRTSQSVASGQAYRFQGWYEVYS